MRSRPLLPRLLPAGSFFGSGLGFFPLRGLLSGLLGPQGLQLFFSLSQNSSLRLRTCPSSRLGVALALGVFQALALVGAASPLTFALLAPSLCSQALSHRHGLLTLLRLPPARPLLSAPPRLFWPPLLSPRLCLPLWQRGLSPVLMGPSPPPPLPPSLPPYARPSQPATKEIPLVSAMWGRRPSPLAGSPRPQSALRTCQRRLARSRR